MSRKRKSVEALHTLHLTYPQGVVDDMEMVAKRWGMSVADCVQVAMAAAYSEKRCQEIVAAADRAFKVAEDLRIQGKVAAAKKLEANAFSRAMACLDIMDGTARRRARAGTRRAK